MFWGFSEAFDFIEDLDLTDIPSEEPINILLFGSGDPRNILKTVAKSYKHSRKIHFYLVEGCMEIIARHMLLLAIAFEDPRNFSLLNKTHLFMDIYGNSLLRPFSYNYIVSKAGVLLKIMTDDEYREKIAPIFSLENLKYRERDSLEMAFTYWQPKREHIFLIDKHWNHLIRKKLGTRYDHREGAFDWDLQMILKYNGCKQICTQEYRHWRETGIAFIFPEYEHSEANKTLAAGVIQNGNKFLNRGYVGDIEVGPYCAFGLSVSADAKMSNCVHGTNDYRATDLTERNLLEIISEIQERAPYIHDQKSSRKLGGVLLALAKPITGPEWESVDLKQYDNPFLDYPNIKIYIQSMNDVFELQRNKKFFNFFHAVFVANTYFPLVTSSLASTFKVNANIYFETKQYTINKKEVIDEFLKNIKQLAKNMKLKSLTHFHINVEHSVVKFKNVNNSDDRVDDEKSLVSDTDIKKLPDIQINSAISSESNEVRETLLDEISDDPKTEIKVNNRSDSETKLIDLETEAEQQTDLCYDASELKNKTATVPTADHNDVVTEDLNFNLKNEGGGDN